MGDVIVVRSFVSRFVSALASSLVVIVLILGPPGAPRVFAQDSAGGISATIALLETRVTWDRGFPFFPANEARYYEGRYDTPTGPVEVYVVEPEIAGVPLFATGAPPPVPCPQAELAVFGSIVEASSPVRNYRVFFRATTGESKVQRATADPAPGEATNDPGVTGERPESPNAPVDLCAFAAAFIDSFEFFRLAAADQGRALSFTGGVKPEFPAVIDLAR